MAGPSSAFGPARPRACSVVREVQPRCLDGSFGKTVSNSRLRMVTAAREPSSTGSRWMDRGAPSTPVMSFGSRSESNPIAVAIYGVPLIKDQGYSPTLTFIST